MTPARPSTSPQLAPATPADPLAGPLRDAQGRALTYLRLSLTDRCNYRCPYCSPADWAGGADLLSAREIVRLVALFARLGIRKVRLTGGEPLVRKDVVEIARGVGELPGIDGVALTTNGHRLAELARELHAAGVTGVNVSVDTLDAARFARLTGGRGDLSAVLEGLAAARQAGIPRLKMNCVVIAGTNEVEVPALIRFAWAQGFVPRFIECMPFGEGRPVPTAQLIQQVRDAGLPLWPVHDAPAGALPPGPSEYWRGEGGLVGFIGPLTRNFCASCNRIRVSASGALHPCLGGVGEVPLAPLLRAGASERELAAAVRDALMRKPDGHAMTAPDARSRLTAMVGLGG